MHSRESSVNIAGMSEQPYDVVILGLGPVGCLAAILLTHQGLRVAAIERDAEVYKLPRAVNLDGEIVRALQPVGLANAVNALLQPVREGERAGFANSKREFLFGNNTFYNATTRPGRRNLAARTQRQHHRGITQLNIVRGDNNATTMRAP